MLLRFFALTKLVLPIAFDKFMLTKRWDIIWSRRLWSEVYVQASTPNDVLSLSMCVYPIRHYLARLSDQNTSCEPFGQSYLHTYVYRYWTLALLLGRAHLIRN